MKLNDKIYLTNVKRKGVIKEFLKNGKVKVSYFDKNDKRFSIEVGIQDIDPIRNDNKYYHAVRRFHKTFNQPAPDMPVRLSEERKAARLKWKQEELDEFKEAQTLEDEVDALIDEIYFCVGSLVEMGVKPDTLFDIVQNANMSKLWPDGKPRFNEDGKIIKPPYWKAPEPLIVSEIQHQIKVSQRRTS